NPGTSPSAIEYVLDDIDLVLVMSVNPGFGGQSFLPSALAKLRQLRERVEAIGKPLLLEVDGGIKPDNIAEVARAGADVFVAGSAIFGQPDYAGIIAGMREQIELGRSG
ncbi:MAG: ribulose-phosphate 3-epimerase, partial [Xanthomonadales bacterium]|nr:ribulose-phosphate 3-epimerase [Xanthomonadales bacterium]